MVGFVKRDGHRGIGLNFGKLVRAPKVIAGVFEKIENVPILGEVVKGIEDLVPQVDLIKQGAKLATDVETRVKDLTGIDIEKEADELDDWLYSRKHNRRDGAHDISTVVPPPHFQINEGNNAHSFNMTSYTSYARGNKYDVATQ